MQKILGIMADKKKGRVFCVGCNKELNDDHLGVKCLAGHDICTECAVNFVSTIFEDPDNNIPVKCMICKGSMIVSSFERQLTPQQFDVFLLHQFKNSTYCADNEMIVSCPHCAYWEVNEKNDGMMLTYCKKLGCKKISCLFCHKKIKMRPFTRDEVDQKDLEGHFECARLDKWKKLWDDAMHRGVTVPCPKCGVSGQKNNACTHMNCPSCATQWCYVCGLGLEALNKHPDYPNFLGHNVGWETNGARCPMWLDNVNEIDDRWPKDDSNACVEFLHRIRLKQEIKRVFTKIPPRKFQALCNKYHIDENCGLDLKQVLQEDHVLIKR